jgi:hypothetical protein
MDLLFVLGAATLVAYTIACLAWPFVNCQRCDGNGKRRSPGGKTFGDCRRCRGAGRRARLGRRLWSLGRDLGAR